MSRRAWVSLAAYAAFAAAALGCALYATLPADAIAGRVAYEMQRATAGAWGLAYQDAAPWRLSGLSLKQVRLLHTRQDGTSETIAVEQARARLQLLPLLLARLSVVWELGQGEGRLRGIVAPGKAGAFHLEVEAQAWNLGQPPLLAGVAGLPVEGRLSGHLDTTWDADQRRIVGHGDLALAKLQIGPGSIAGIGLPQVQMGDLDMQIELKEGRFKLGNFKQSGGNLTLQGRAAVQLKEPLVHSMLELCWMLRIDAAFLAANPKLRSAIQLAEMQLKRDGEGFLHIPVGGTVGGPRLGGGMCR